MARTKNVFVNAALIFSIFCARSDLFLSAVENFLFIYFLRGQSVRVKTKKKDYEKYRYVTAKYC